MVLTGEVKEPLAGGVKLERVDLWVGEWGWHWTFIASLVPVLGCFYTGMSRQLHIGSAAPSPEILFPHAFPSRLV